MTLIHVTHCLVIRYLISLYIVVVNQTHIFNFSDITNFELGHISFGLMQDWIRGGGGDGGWRVCRRYMLFYGLLLSIHYKVMTYDPER